MLKNSVFFKACRQEPTEYTPVWLMRQAGRYLKEYRAIRKKVDFLTMCKTPDLAAEVTLQPVEKLGVDAAIIFSDILLPLEKMGIELEFSQRDGPVIHNPIRTEKEIGSLRIIEPEEDVPFVLEAIKKVCKALNEKIPLIGFSGGPFTLASYIIEGGHSQNYINTKKLMYHNPAHWHLLLEKLGEVVTRYLNAQIESGVQVIQVFDSWAGCLSPQDYTEFVFPHSRYVFRGLKKDVPAIHFATGTSTLLELMQKAGGNVIGIDWRINLSKAWERLRYKVGIQGNLDPVTLFAPIPIIKNRVKEILRSADNRPGHIFNLGHGILPQTPVENVIALVEAVHEFSQRKKLGTLAQTAPGRA
ncbi:MAG: uroporphyrinogen decarboxylase [Deltaproteobacteria bacterium]|nr:uroporphyrinogen decarboxylase [Deltaproteobacteria bacterium]